MKVLVCSEFSQIGSGYAVYTKELVSGLHRRGIEVAELASYCRVDDERRANCPWGIYPVMPHSQDKNGWDLYNAHPGNVFGRHIYESVLLDYKPTHVIDIRDIWNLVHEITSPYRDFYSHILMPAVDSDPQNKSWLEMYKTTNGIITYCDWSTQLLKGLGLTNVVGDASPVPCSDYKPLEDKAKLKSSLGLGDDIRIIGTVMRNQPRKLYPNLFRMFRKFLNTVANPEKYYLYCHTSYPDLWELDELILEHDLGHKVLFTYACHGQNCRPAYIETSFYKGPVASCPKCGGINTHRLPAAYNPISPFTLNQLYNVFDLYIQYAALEGYGIPVAEAIAAGIPTMSVNYSATETFIKHGGSISIEPKAYHIEPETGRRFAIPDDDDTVNKMTQFFDKPSRERAAIGSRNRFIYGMRNFDDCVDTWVKALENTAPKLSWDTPSRNYRIQKDFPKNLPNELFVKWLIMEVIQDKSLLGSYLESRLVRDLENGFAITGYDGKYHFEAGSLPVNKFQGNFAQEVAFFHFNNLNQEKVEWEQRRVASL